MAYFEVLAHAQDFPCTVKAMKTGRSARRPSWDYNSSVFLDKKDRTAYIWVDGVAEVWTASGDDMLAQDWEVLL